jgi:hypothetical protein
MFRRKTKAVLADTVLATKIRPSQVVSIVRQEMGVEALHSRALEGLPQEVKVGLEELVRHIKTGISAKVDRVQ